jgi:hypothetical protein
MNATNLPPSAEGKHRTWAALEYSTLGELENSTDDEIGCAIAAVESEHSQLTHSGWYDGKVPRPVSVATHPAYRKEVRMALTFIRQHVVAQEIVNSAANSFRLARIASKWAASEGHPDGISNGAFVTAAVIAGYEWLRYPGSGLSCAFNMYIGVGALIYEPGTQSLLRRIADTLGTSR